MNQNEEIEIELVQRSRHTSSMAGEENRLEREDLLRVVLSGSAGGCGDLRCVDANAEAVS